MNKSDSEEIIKRIKPKLKAVWDARWFIITINGAIFVLTTLYLLFFVNPYFESTVYILPDSGMKSSITDQFSGIASLAGVNLGGGNSTALYPQLLTSESVLGPVLRAKFISSKGEDNENLIEYFGVDAPGNYPDSTRQRLLFLKALKFLKGMLTTDYDLATKMVTVKIRADKPELASQIVNKIILSLEKYLKTQRKSYATEQRQYIETRIGQVKDSLMNAENTLAAFEANNRNVTQSPELSLVKSRMQRSVTLLNTVYLQLAQQYELAKIQEVKDTPVLNVEEYAQNPVVKAGPHRVITLMTIIFMTFLITVVYFYFSNDLKKFLLQLKN